MPQTKKTPYFLLFLLSISFIAISLFAYNYTSGRVSKELVLKNIKDIQTTPTSIVMPTIGPDIDISSPSATSVDIVPVTSPTPTPGTPYLKSFASADQNFKVDYMSTRKLFQDNSSIAHRFVFVHSQGNFVIHVGNKSYTWTHSGRTFNNRFTLAGKQTFVFNTTSQKVIDLKTDNGLFYTLQCVHNGHEELINECQDFIQSFQFLN